MNQPISDQQLIDELVAFAAAPKEGCDQCRTDLICFVSHFEPDSSRGETRNAIKNILESGIDVNEEDDRGYTAIQGR